MITEAAHILYVIAKMLIATQFLKWKRNVYLSGCLVLCFKQGCGSVTWTKKKKLHPGFEKCWHCTEVLKKKKTNKMFGPGMCNFFIVKWKEQAAANRKLY